MFVSDMGDKFRKKLDATDAVTGAYVHGSIRDAYVNGKTDEPVILFTGVTSENKKLYVCPSATRRRRWWPASTSRISSTISQVTLIFTLTLTLTQP